jgi:hypothetical protein
MRVIAMMPARNEAWVIEHSLACLSQFCDVILVSDRNSDDATRQICARFPKTVVLEPGPESRIREQRWQLLDAARDYDGHNLLWASDADELVSPRLMMRFLEDRRGDLAAGRVVECLDYTLWNGPREYREYSYYQPFWNRVGFVDDRRTDFDRSTAAPLHEPRIPADGSAPIVRAESVPLLHLQWLIPQRNQLKQAWYRCRELLDGRDAAAINEFYAVTFHGTRVATSPVPPEWTADITFPAEGGDLAPSWHQRDILAWFDQYGIERFEPLEIWHVPALQQEFRRRVGRAPRPDRSYLPPWPVRARRLGRRLFNAARRRMPV